MHEQLKQTYITSRFRHYVNRGMYEDHPELEAEVVKYIQASDMAMRVGRVISSQMVGFVSERDMIVAQNRLASISVADKDFLDRFNGRVQ